MFFHFHFHYSQYDLIKTDTLAIYHIFKNMPYDNVDEESK